MFKRQISSVLQKTADEFPVTFLTGPRQSGKTTLLRTLFPNYHYINLESADNRLQAEQDPRGFIEQYPHHVIFDEAQNVPTLFSYLQEYIDNKHTHHCILSGSQHFLLAEKITQSLAGRAAILELLPLSFEELQSIEVTDDIWRTCSQGTYP